jgi:hypothetical protein
MSDDEQARWTQIFDTHPVAGRVTAERISVALTGYPIRGEKWLARAVQPAVYLAAKQTLPRKGLPAVRNELQELTNQTRAVCTALFHISSEAEDSLWQFARSLPDATDDSANAEMAFFKQSRERLTGTLRFLDDAAARVAAQKQSSQKWERAADMELRKWFAVWLSPAFEEGFGRKATLSNANRTDRHEHGHWADFYERMMGLAFERPKPDNLRRVLAEARKVTKRAQSAAAVVRFPAGWFPQ